MDQKKKAQTLQYDPIVEELVNLSNEVADEKLKKRLEAIIDLRYQRDAYGTEFNTPASPALQTILCSTVTENWDTLLQENEISARCSRPWYLDYGQETQMADANKKSIVNDCCDNVQSSAWVIKWRSLEIWGDLQSLKHHMLLPKRDHW